MKKFPRHFNAWITPDRNILWTDQTQHADISKAEFGMSMPQALKAGFVRVSWEMFSTKRIVHCYDLKRDLPLIQSALLPLYEQVGDVVVLLNDHVTRGLNRERVGYLGDIGLATVVLGNLSEILHPESLNPKGRRR